MAKELGDGYNLLYSSGNETINGVEIVIDQDLKDKIENVTRIGNKISSAKLALEKEMYILLACMLHKLLQTRRLRSNFEIH